MAGLCETCCNLLEITPAVQVILRGTLWLQNRCGLLRDML
jgi:hypothetical protein